MVLLHALRAQSMLSPEERAMPAQAMPMLCPCYAHAICMALTMPMPRVRGEAEEPPVALPEFPPRLPRGSRFCLLWMTALLDSAASFSIFACTRRWAMLGGNHYVQEFASCLRGWRHV